MPKRIHDEDAVLDRIRRAAQLSRASAGGFLMLGIGDDAALVRPRPGCETILTCDWFLEGTHFLRDKHSPDSVGWKSLARATSDIAAMGGSPRCFLLSLALPRAQASGWLDAFLKGLRRAARHFHCPLAGGDTTRRPEILINITVVGEIHTGTALRRSGARPGDVIYVSGRLGEAELGLKLLTNRSKLDRIGRAALRKHLYPKPRLALGQWLARNRVASAMMDLSDGLSTDLPRLCRASGVGARIESELIPSVGHRGVARNVAWDPGQLALNGGDDYELLFTVPPRRAKQLPESFHGLRLTCIGRLTSRETVCFVGTDGKEGALRPQGWDPFRDNR